VTDEELQQLTTRELRDMVRSVASQLYGSGRAYNLVIRIATRKDCIRFLRKHDPDRHPE
jgi:hypothetical protein